MNKILFLHTNYRIFGGEDVAVNNEIEYLSNHYNVRSLFFNNSNKINLNDLNTFLFQTDVIAKTALNKEIDISYPDIAYVHNIWFRGSLSLISTLLKKNIKVVLKLHNFRFDCANALHFRDNNICHDCTPGNRLPGIKYKCYENSYLKSIFITQFGKKYLELLKSSNLEILVTTEFHKEYLSKSGVNSEKIHISPNMFPLAKTKPTYSPLKRNSFLYAGRLSAEKGLFELINVWKEINVKNYKLIIAGDGPLKKDIAKHVNQLNSIELMGFVPQQKLYEVMRTCRAVISATKVYENHPTLLTEASLMGVPSIFPNFGGMKYFFPENYPLMFNQYNYQELISIVEMTKDDTLMERLGADVYNHIQNHLSSYNLEETFNRFMR